MAALTGLLGLWLVAQLKAWAQGFAAGTARRLEELVAYCTDIVAGRAVAVQQQSHGLGKGVGEIFRSVESWRIFSNTRDARGIGGCVQTLPTLHKHRLLMATDWRVHKNLLETCATWRSMPS